MTIWETVSADTTGVPAGKVLKDLTAANKPNQADSISGTRFFIDTPSTVWDGWRFPYTVVVRAPDVEFRNCYFEGAKDGKTGLLLVETDPKYKASARAYFCTFIPKYPNNSMDGVRGSSFRLSQCEIAKTVDGIGINGHFDYNGPAGNVVVSRSWIHDLIHYNDTSHPDGTHNDGVQVHGGSNIQIVGNRFDGMIYNATFMIKRDFNQIADVLIADNYISGGACSINLADENRVGPIAGVKILSNTFGKNQGRAGCAMTISSRSKAVATIVNNRWTGGAVIATQRAAAYTFTWSNDKKKWEFS